MANETHRRIPHYRSFSGMETKTQVISGDEIRSAGTGPGVFQRKRRDTILVLEKEQWTRERAGQLRPIKKEEEQEPARIVLSGEQENGAAPAEDTQKAPGTPASETAGSPEGSENGVPVVVEDVSPDTSAAASIPLPPTPQPSSPPHQQKSISPNYYSLAARKAAMARKEAEQNAAAEKVLNSLTISKHGFHFNGSSFYVLSASPYDASQTLAVARRDLETILDEISGRYANIAAPYIAGQCMHYGIPVTWDATTDCDRLVDSLHDGWEVPREIAALRKELACKFLKIEGWVGKEFYADVGMAAAPGVAARETLLAPTPVRPGQVGCGQKRGRGDGESGVEAKRPRSGLGGESFLSRVQGLYLLSTDGTLSSDTPQYSCAVFHHPQHGLWAQFKLADYEGIIRFKALPTAYQQAIPVAFKGRPASGGIDYWDQWGTVWFIQGGYIQARMNLGSASFQGVRVRGPGGVDAGKQVERWRGMYDGYYTKERYEMESKARREAS